tara:strand:+ start:1216 stop:1323 length:108 start_codon:yes stop_codon:yes gene_type:complete
MEKIKSMWSNLSKKGKMFVAGCGVILLIIIISNIV